MASSRGIHDGREPTIRLSSRKGTVLDLILRCHPDIDARDTAGWTPLHVASLCGNVGVAQELLRHEADINLPTAAGWTPLYVACKKGYEEIAEKLIAANAPVDLKNVRGETPLHAAAKAGFESIARLLLRKGADPQSRDKKGKTPLESSSRPVDELYHKRKLYRCVETRLHDRSGSSKGVECEEGVRWFNDEASGTSVEDRQMRHRLDRLVPSAKQPLHQAAHDGLADAVRCLLDSGAEVNSADDHDLTALHFAMKNDHEAVARLLLERGASANATVEGTAITPLKIALHKRNGRMAELLLQHGVQPDADQWMAVDSLFAGEGERSGVALLMAQRVSLESRDQRRNTALHLAVRCGQPAAVRRLLQRGADVNARDDKERTPLNGAVKRCSTVSGTEVIRAILGHEPVITARDWEGVLAVQGESDKSRVAVFMARSVLLESRDKHGNTALHLAVQCNQPEAVAHLLQRGADVNAKNGEERTPLNDAINSCKKAVAVVLRYEPVVAAADWEGVLAVHDDKAKTECLLARLAAVNSTCPNGRSPLHITVLNRNLKAMDILISRGADSAATDEKGLTPLHYATLLGHADVFSALLRHCADIEKRDKWGRTLLHLAAFAGNGFKSRQSEQDGNAVIRLLRPHRKDKHGQPVKVMDELVFREKSMLDREEESLTAAYSFAAAFQRADRADRADGVLERVVTLSSQGIF